MTQTLTRRQAFMLVALTIAWGLNWPVMKVGVTDFPPLTFRAISLWIGAPLLGLALLLLRQPLAVPRAQFRPLFWLGLTNMFVWHALLVLALQSLSSGRAAILGYTMPIFAAVFGALYFGERLRARAWSGVAAAALGVVLLLWHELSNMAGRPLGVLLALVGAAVWAVGTHMMRRHRIPLPTPTIVFWMTAMSMLIMSVLAVVFERQHWKAPSAAVWGAILYNGVLIFSVAQVVWFSLARALPPVASTLGVMMIPILGVFSGAWWLDETLHWQDWTAMALMVLAIASVLWPQRATRPAP